MHITFYQYSNLIIHREKHTGLVGRGFFVHFYSFVCFFIIIIFIIIIIIIIICLYVFYICVFISVIVVDCTLVKICFRKKKFSLNYNFWLFLDQLDSKRVFPVKNKKKEHQHGIPHIQGYAPNFTLNKQLGILRPNLLKKCYSDRNVRK